MPYEFHIDHEKRLIHKKVWGLYNDVEAIESTLRFSQIDVHEEYDELHDLIGVTSYEVSSKTISERARDSVAAEKSEFDGKKVAIVVPSKLVHGMTRMYMGYHEGSKEEIRIFSELQLAQQWLAGSAT